MRKGEETKAAILNKAVTLAARDGIHGLSIGNLANEMGLSKSGLFAHFGSKEALQIAILDATVVSFIEAVIKPALKAPGGLPRIMAMADLWFRWIDLQSENCGCPLRAISGELEGRDGPLTEYVGQRQRDFDRTIAKLGESAIQRGHFREDLDVAQFAFEMHSIIGGYHFAHSMLKYRDADKRAHIAIDRIIADALAPGIDVGQVLASAGKTTH